MIILSETHTSYVALYRDLERRRGSWEEVERDDALGAILLKLRDKLCRINGTT